jgi:hypothetical protein
VPFNRSRSWTRCSCLFSQVTPGRKRALLQDDIKRFIDANLRHTPHATRTLMWGRLIKVRTAHRR